MYPDNPPQSTQSKQIYSLINQIEQGDIAWDSFTIQYNGQLPIDGPIPPWMADEYKVWYRDPLLVLEDQIGNPEFALEMDIAPKQVFQYGKRRYKDVLLGNWTWQQCDILAKDEETHGAMHVPIILGSDKTTVSVATGQNEFYPLYAAIANTHNAVRRAHRNTLALIGFLAIPKEQALLACIVQHWCPKCTALPNNLDEGDAVPRRHNHTAALLSECLMKELWDDYGTVGDLFPFTDMFPRADIHELLTPDLLHQAIKGTFKDHIIEWVHKYIYKVHTKCEADKIMADIDRR
ncbi:hypothetical protein C0991_007416, partial [Blastosporella zonata]